MGTSVVGKLNTEKTAGLPGLRDAMAGVGAQGSTTAFNFFAAFDGTNNDRNNLALSGDPYPTNIADLQKQAKSMESDLFRTEYYPGVGTGEDRGGTINAGIAPNAPIQATALNAYGDFRDAAVKYLKQNPGSTPEDISASVAGFSRGGATAVKFAQLVNERGLVDAEGNVLAPPGSIPITGMALLDPVGRFVDGDLSIPPNVQGQVLVVQAANENRSDFRPFDYSNDERVTTVHQAGNHVGIGGGYDQGGTAANVREGVTGYFQNRGVAVADVPVEQRFDPTQETKLYTEAYQVDTQGNVLTNEDGSPRYAWQVDDPAQDRQLDSLQHPEAQTEEQLAANSAALVSTLANMAHWSEMTDVQRAASLSALYNTVDHMNNGELAGDLGGAASALSFVSALQNGNAGSVLVSGVSLANALGENFASKEIASAIGMSGAAANVVPGLSLALAIDSGNSMSVVAAAANFIPVYGPMVSVGISLLGSSLLGDDKPPPPEGSAHFSWDANGHIQHTIDFNQSGGGDAANQVAASVQTMLQSLVDAHNAQNASTADDIAINPYLLPKFGFSEKSAWMEVTSPDGVSMREGIGDADFAQRLLAALQDNGALAPAWQVQTQHMHYQQALQEGQSQSDAEALMSMGRGGRAYAGNEAFSLQGNAVESSDFKSQSFGALVVHLNDNSEVQAAQTQLSNVLRDVEGDGYFEQTQSVAAKDSAGNLQAMLTIDFNGDGVIQTRDILNVGGNTNTDNPTDEARLANAHADQQRNNVEWLDANGDGILDKSDPAFTAIRLWVDVNQDSVQSGNEVSSLAVMHISSINFKTGEVTYEDGHTDALTAQTLKADTEGVKFTQINEVNPDGTLHTLDAGTVLEHEGYQGKVQITDAGGTRWANVREQTYEQQANRTGDWEGTAEQDAHRHGGGNVAEAPTETTATGAADLGPVKTQANVITQRTVTADQVRNSPSAERVAFVPVNNTLEVRNVTASMIESIQDNLMTGGGLNLSLLGAVTMAASTAAAGERPVLASTPATDLHPQPALVQPASPLHLPNAKSTPTPVQIAVVRSAPEGLTAAEEGGLGGTHVSAKPTHADALWPLEFVAPVTPNSVSQSLVQGSSAVLLKTATVANSSFYTAPADVVLDYPVVYGETVFGAEDVVFLISGALLVGNDITPNALADPGKPALTVTAVGEATHGVVSLVNGAVIFTPEANYYGMASFSYTVTDQFGLSTSGISTLQIAAVNDAPVTQGEISSTDEDVGLRFIQAQLLANDHDVDTATDGQVLSISRVGNATNGTVSLDANGDIRYIPDVHYNGEAQFTYWVSDGNGAETPATVNMNIAAVNDLPVVYGERVNGSEDVVLKFAPADLLANDSDVDTVTNGQVLYVSGVSNAQHGYVAWVTQSDGTQVIEFSPDENYHGIASYDYTVSDGNAGEVTTTVVMNLAAVNDAPVARGGEEVDSQEEEELTIPAAGLLRNDTDMDVATDGQTLSLSRVANATHGSVRLHVNGDVLFKPEENYNGDATFTYWVKDNLGAESQGVTATLHISPVNDAPSAQGEMVTGASEDASFHINASTLLANDHDIDNADSDLRLAWVGNAQHGTVALDTNGNVVFEPDKNYNGTARFSYKLKDPDGLESPEVQASFGIAAVNDAPVAVDDQFTTYQNSTLTIAFNELTGNDTDIDHDTLTVSAVRDHANGHASIVNGQVQFAATTGFNGAASFDYLIDDGKGGQTWATSYVAVKELPNLFPSIDISGTSCRQYYEGGNVIGYTVSVSFAINDDDDPSAAHMSLVSISTAGGAYTGYTLSQSASGGTITFQHVDVCEMTWRITDARGLDNYWHYYFERYNFEGTSYASRGYSDHSGYFYPPVILDLNGDGTHFTSLVDSKVAFDVNFDGLADSIAWAGNDDGVLVWDKDQNNQITDASEFGFQTLKADAQTDLEGLQALDTNGNGLLDAGDAKFAEFAVWQDANGNGVTDADEFKTLTELGIAHINLHSDGKMRDAGTPLANSGSGETDVTVMGNAAFTRTDGTTGLVADTMLAYEPGHATQVVTQVVDTSASDAQTAEIMRQALLFNQVCNTAFVIDSTPLGFMPIQPDVQMHDMLVAPQDGSHQFMQSA